MLGVSMGRTPYDVIGASEGPDIGSLAPDSQSFLIRALATHLDNLSAVILKNKDAPVEQVEYEIDNSNITTGGQNYKLPTGQPIIAYYVENNSAATLSVFAGASGSGRAINTIAPLTYKAALMPQALTMLSILTSSLVTTGTVRIVLTSAVLSPVMGSTVGAVTASGLVTAAPPASNTATQNSIALALASATIVQAANPNRVGWTCYNNSSGNVQLGFGTAPTASTNSALAASYANYSLPVNYKGPIYAYGGASGLLIVTEYT